MKANIAYVPEDRLTQGLFLDCTIQENTVAASIRKYLKKGRLNYGEMYEATQVWIQKIGCNAKSPRPLIRTLSGGNAQKMVIAKWLKTVPRLLIMDEPTAGVDIGAKGEVIEIVREYASNGNGVLFISSEMSELLAVCDRIIVYCDLQRSGGDITAILNQKILK